MTAGELRHAAASIRQEIPETAARSDARTGAAPPARVIRLRSGCVRPATPVDLEGK